MNCENVDYVEVASLPDLMGEHPSQLQVTVWLTISMVAQVAPTGSNFPIERKNADMSSSLLNANGCNYRTYMYIWVTINLRSTISQSYPVCSNINISFSFCVRNFCILHSAGRPAEGTRKVVPSIIINACNNVNFPRRSCIHWQHGTLETINRQGAYPALPVRMALYLSSYLMRGLPQRRKQHCVVVV